MGVFRGSKVKGASTENRRKRNKVIVKNHWGHHCQSLCLHVGLVLVKGRHRGGMLTEKPDHTAHRSSNIHIEIFCCEKEISISKMG